MEQRLHSKRVQERNQIGFLLGSKTDIETHVVKDEDIRQCRGRTIVKIRRATSLELDRGKASKAIEILEPAAAFDLAEPPPVSLTTLYLPYLRGSAYLAEGNGERAAAQYQKLLEHRTVIANKPLGALAYVGLGRAYAQERYIETSRTAYETFFSLWKDADPDIPILREAKAEYAKLR